MFLSLILGDTVHYNLLTIFHEGFAVVVKGKTALFFNTGIFRQIELIHGFPFVEDTRTADPVAVAVKQVRRKLYDFVGGCGKVGVDIPGDVACVDGTVVELDFHTVVSHRANVHRVRRITERRSDGDVEEHVGNLTLIVFYGTREHAFEEREVNTGIEVV